MTIRNLRVCFLVFTVIGFVTSAGLPPAEAADTYHGTITGGTFFCNGIQVSGPSVTGTWNLNIDGKTPAQVTLNVFYNGSHRENVQTNTLTKCHCYVAR